MNNEFNIGDIVQITNTDGNYTCFVRMAEYMQLINFKRAEICPIYTDLKIVAVQEHDEYVGEVVYGVRDIATGKEYLVGDDFMVLVKTASQYTLEDLRNKYVRVGTPEYEVFMGACEELGVTWKDNGEYGEMPFSGYVSLTHFDSLIWGKTSLTLITMGFRQFTPKVSQLDVIAEETPWTIYNNTLPMSDLSDDQASQLFIAWRNGDQVLQHGAGVCPRWGKSSIYQIKRKSERDEFVEKALTFTNYKGKYGEQDVAHITGLLYDAGCRFV